MAALRGQILRLVIGLPSRPSTALTGVITIIASQDLAAQPGPGVCVAKDEDVLRAYTIVAGLNPQEVSGAQFLIDGNGWLRGLQGPDAAPGWDDPGTLAQAVAEIRAHPMAGAEGDHAHMQM